ncbi:MAG: hypothetical protein ACON39_04835 [Coraliomargaritaceae bacterium]
MAQYYLGVVVSFIFGAAFTAQAISIELDYSYDINGFFEQAGAKEAMREAADFFEELIQDSLLRIDPDAYSGTNNTWTAWVSHPGTGGLIEKVDLIVPADTLIVFAGGRNLGGSIGLGGPGGIAGGSGSTEWVNAVLGRGQAGVLASPVSDFAPWGGTIIFNNQVNWHFQVDGRPVGSSDYDFISTALHELGHLLGIGTANSWETQVDNNLRFNGTRSVASFGGPVPVTSDKGHWQDDGNCPYDPNGLNNVTSRTYGSFGTDHGNDQIAILDPQSCLVRSEPSLRVFTDLDLAALADIGWEISFPLRLEVGSFEPGQFSVLWASSTGATAFLQRVTDLGGPWSDVLPPVSGDGSLQLITDDSAPAGKAFYRLSESAALSGSPASQSLTVFPLSVESSSTGGLSVFSVTPSHPLMIESCSVCSDCR